MSDPAARARALTRERPVFDAHADSLQLACDLGRDLSLEGPGQLDLARGREGGLGELVCVCWADARYAERPGAARARTRDLLGAFHRQLAASPDALAWAGNAELARAARARGAVAGIPGIEGGHSIEESLDELEAFFRHGVRVLTLVWNNHLAWVRSCRDGAGPHVPEGLSDFGREVVGRMNALGMVVDLSHAGRRSFFDALEASDRPVIASHSGCMAVNEHPRNLDDEQLRSLAQNGGVVGIVFCSAFLDAECMSQQRAASEDPEYKALSGANDSELFLRQGEWLQAHLPPLSLERVADHVCHAVETAGIDHVGIGSD
ncbi:MAG TPA: membrane dipeptidase, partial [Planctomycetota bacterium]|nr:membrane dipeptidase [Planctomycetota bacterium]